MGSAVQEVFQRRGGKKRAGAEAIKKIAPFTVLFLLSWLGLFFKLLLLKPLYLYLWFLVTISPAFLYLFLRFKEKHKVPDFTMLLPAVFLIAGAIQYFKYSWLHLLYLLYLIPLVAFFSRRTVILLVLSIPAVELRHFMEPDNLLEEISLNLAVLISVAMILAIVEKANKEETSYKAPLKSLRNPIEPDNEVEIGSIKDDIGMTQYLSSVAKADDEIRDVLSTIKQSILADSVHFFSSQGNSLNLRCTTEESRDITLMGEGFITQCFREKRTIITSKIDEKGYEVGYLKKGKIASFIALPVIDEPYVLGVLCADTSRFAAFTDIEASTLLLFTKQLIRILQRERIYSQVQRSLTGFKVLHEESSKLALSLKVDVLAQRLVESSKRIAPSSITFLLKKGAVFEVVNYADNTRLEKKSFSLKGTLLDMVKKNMEPLYLSDVRNYNTPILPFRTTDVSSVFILPLIYEKEFTGMLVFLSEKISAFNPHQIELLEVLGTQASISIANANLHAEIQQMATTDGLTGLFNHRVFQEELVKEFKRYERFLEPLSLLLLDIDYFKKVNDTYGHPAGDKILRGVAKILKSTLRNIDIAARYGGEEFAAILPGTDIAGAKNMAERLRRTIMETTFNLDSKGVKVTVSIGIANIAGADDKKDNLIERADKALYYAKKNGRNQSILWSEIRG